MGLCQGGLAVFGEDAVADLRDPTMNGCDLREGPKIRESPVATRDEAVTDATRPALGHAIH